MIYIQLDGGHFGIYQYGGPIGRPSLAPGKNESPMTLLTAVPKLVLLEESEPNSPFVALTPLTVFLFVHPISQMCAGAYNFTNTEVALGKKRQTPGYIICDECCDEHLCNQKGCAESGIHLNTTMTTSPLS